MIYLARMFFASPTVFYLFQKRLLRIYIERELDGSAKSSDSVRLNDNIMIR